MKEILEYKRKKIEQYKKELSKTHEEDGLMSGLNDVEYNKMSVKQKSSTTRRTHARGNLWNHQNLGRVKSDVKYWWK